MAEDEKSPLHEWTRRAASVAGDAATTAKHVAEQTLDTASKLYENSRIKGAVDEAVTRTKDHLDKSGITDAARTVSDSASDVLDTVSGKKILDLMEQRNTLQDKYNDVLATKLEEALRRIARLEEILRKQGKS